MISDRIDLHENEDNTAFELLGPAKEDREIVHDGRLTISGEVKAPSGHEESEYYS